jgi:glycosyltransferase involved in cell wall biosynthesis
VLFLGKEILSKGLDLLLAAWPLVLQRQPDAHLVVTGFGTWHTTAVRMTEALAKGDLAAVREIAEEGRGAEGGPPGPLRHLLAFLDGLEGEARQRFLDAAASMHERVVFTGRLVHEELADLLPVCEALVVPSTFPEAYGMVAAEAAACGVLPISAGHSGAKEVSAMLAAAVPQEAREWLSFPVDDDAVRAIAARVRAWLQASDEVRAATRAALVATARERFSWEVVAGGVVAAAEGRLSELPPVA